MKGHEDMKKKAIALMLIITAAGCSNVGITDGDLFGENDPAQNIVKQIPEPAKRALVRYGETRGVPAPVTEAALAVIEERGLSGLLNMSDEDNIRIVLDALKHGGYIDDTDLAECGWLPDKDQVDPWRRAPTPGVDRSLLAGTPEMRRPVVVDITNGYVVIQANDVTAKTAGQQVGVEVEAQ